jgi:hypothetical protein
MTVMPATKASNTEKCGLMVSTLDFLRVGMQHRLALDRPTGDHAYLVPDLEIATHRIVEIGMIHLHVLLGGVLLVGREDPSGGTDREIVL